jgi:monovalent cation/hydrogen antiporter
VSLSPRPSRFQRRFRIAMIVPTAFAVVLGTLAIQGLTLKPLLRALDLHDDDPVGRELNAARERALSAALASFDNDRSPVAELVRREFTARLAHEGRDGNAAAAAHNEIHRRALQAARQAVLAMRADDEIGDDAFHRGGIRLAGNGKREGRNVNYDY